MEAPVIHSSQSFNRVRGMLRSRKLYRHSSYKGSRANLS
jgi:hypothetical protein